MQAWTRPGPWRYEGKHFHYRHVNPWALPYQKPHPPMWIPGTLSPETVRWCAEHRYPYIGLGTALGRPATCGTTTPMRRSSTAIEAGSGEFRLPDSRPSSPRPMRRRRNSARDSSSAAARTPSRASEHHAAAGIQLERGNSDARQAAAGKLARSQRRQDARPQSRKSRSIPSGSDEAAARLRRRRRTVAVHDRQPQDRDRQR